MRVQTLGQVPRPILEAHALEHRALHRAGLEGRMTGLRSRGLGAQEMSPATRGAIILGTVALGFLGAYGFGWVLSRA